MQVEERSSLDDRFGQGREIVAPFSRIVDMIASGDGLHYMTTQDLRRDAEGRSLLTAPPVSNLLDDVPLRLPLLQKLVPVNLNLWFGGGTGYSGLHHDFHSNLYILLRGWCTSVPVGIVAVGFFC